MHSTPEPSVGVSKYESRVSVPRVVDFGRHYDVERSSQKHLVGNFRDDM